MFFADTVKFCKTQLQ